MGVNHFFKKIELRSPDTAKLISQVSVFSTATT